MKILVTGGCGFLGSHVCDYFREKGDEVIAFDNLTKFELKRTGYNVEEMRMYNWRFLREKGVKLVKGDVADFEELKSAVKGCDYIVHTAAQPAMTISVEYPRLDLTSNIIGTFNVLECARKHDIPIASCSTIHVYGNKINEELREGESRYLRVPPEIDENYPTLGGALTPLHVSKRSTELYVQAFMDSYGLRAAVFRLTGLYGERQFGGEDHGWVANFTIRTIMNRPITIFGSGKQVRDILYAGDVSRAFSKFYDSNKKGVFNIGGSYQYSTSLLECLDLIEKITGVKPKINFAPVRFGDLFYFVCNISRAKKELGWKPSVPPEEGIRRLASWVSTHKHLFGG